MLFRVQFPLTIEPTQNWVFKTFVCLLGDSDEEGFLHGPNQCDIKDEEDISQNEVNGMPSDENQILSDEDEMEGKDVKKENHQ